MTHATVVVEVVVGLATTITDAVVEVVVKSAAA